MPTRILLIAGPAGSGKSTLIRQLRDGTLSPEIRARLPEASSEWEVVEANDVMKGDLPSDAFAGTLRKGGVLAHYDIVFIHRHGVSDYEDDPALRLLAEAGPMVTVLVRPNPAQLREQYADRLQRLQAGKSRGSRWSTRWLRGPLRRMRAFLWGRPRMATSDWYLQESALDEAYLRWECFCRNLVSLHPESEALCVEPISSVGVPPAFRLLSMNPALAVPTTVTARSRGKLGVTAGGWRVERQLADLLKGRLVLSVLGGGRIGAASLREHGAKDVLMLDRGNPLTAVRDPLEVRMAYRRIPDVRKNNCNLALLHGTSILALLEKREFARLEYVLVPAGPSCLLAVLGLLKYGGRGMLRVAGHVAVPCRHGPRRYLVLEARVSLRGQARQYGPAGLSHLELLQRLEGVDYVYLGAVEPLAAGRNEGDLDILVSTTGLEQFMSRFGGEVGLRSFDVYTADGQEGHVFKDVPYFTGQLSREMLRDPVVDANGVRLPSPQWRYLAYCYHLLFHDKVPPNPPGAPRLSEDSFTKPHYHRELERLASLAGVPVAQTFDDMERQLRDAGVMPSLDMIGFYSNRNPFLAKRYFNGGPTAVGLATFFVRDFGLGLQAVPQLRAGLLKTFEILAEGPVDDTNRERVLNGVRGSNWSDPNAPGGRAEPVYWFVCWDHAPRRPSARTRRKHPRVDNENIRLKDDLRREFDGSDKARRIIHSSDNSPEALEHLKHLGLDLDALRRSPPVC